jgi:hypothetical protein
MSAKKTYHLKTKDPGEKLILGLVCDEKDYRLSWLINQHLGTSLSKTDNLSWMSKKLPTAQEFPSFHDNKSVYGKCLLIKNLSLESIKIPNYSKFDYLFILSESDQKVSGLLREIKEIRGIFELEESGLDGFDF